MDAECVQCEKIISAPIEKHEDFDLFYCERCGQKFAKIHAHKFPKGI